MKENTEMQPHVATEYQPFEGRVIRIEAPMDEATRKAGVTAPAIELRPLFPGAQRHESLIVALIKAFSFPYRRGMQAPEGWNEQKAEWERQAKLADIRSQLK